MNYKIWKYGQDDWKVFLDDQYAKDEIATWDGCRLHCYYYLKGRINGWDIIFPSKQHDKILKFVNNSRNGGELLKHK